MIVLGLGPLAASIWLDAATTSAGRIYSGLIPVLVAVLLAAAAWYGGKPLFRLVEANFWSLNALAVQPGYALAREGLRHLAEKRLVEGVGEDRRDRIRAVSALAAGLVVCLLSLAFVAVAWPHTRWTGTLADLVRPGWLAFSGLANAVAIIGAYVAIAALAWGVADATMAQPRAISRASRRRRRAPGSGASRISPTSISSASASASASRAAARDRAAMCGSSGCSRRSRTIDRTTGLDLVLISGDVTDAGRAAEWAEFFDAIDAHPTLRAKTIAIPGNHDLNVVDRANPARLDLPLSPMKRLRQMRTLSGLAALQGERVHVADPATGRRGQTLAAALAPHAEDIARFADSGARRLGAGLGPVFAAAFPMVLPPSATGGLGVVLLNSNAETHFSFTNALGFMPRAQEAAMASLLAEAPDAVWIVALHHHVVEYPRAAKALSERIRHRRSSTARGSSAACSSSAAARSSCTAIAMSTGSARAAGSW